MASEWKICTLGDVLTLQRGFDLPVQNRVAGRFPVVASTGVIGYHNEAQVRAPGVVIGRSGSIGGGQYLEQPFWPLNTTLWVKDFKGNDERFCYYLLKSIDFKAFNVGSGVPTLNRNHIHPLPVVIPCLEEQQTISQLLGLIDQRVDLLQQTNATLEAIANALFKSWFVDFDPVRANADSLTPVGIDADIAAQFPSGFEESELGLIPKGWAISPISSLATVKGGKQLDRKYFDTDAENPIFGGAGEMGRTVLANADGLVLTVGRVGAYCGQFFWHLGPAWVNNNASHIIPLRESSGYWLYWSLRNSNVDKIKKGAAQPFVSNSDIASISVVCPPCVIESAFHQVAAALHESMMSNLAKGTQLVRFRDTLLPRLISGKLRLPEAEALIEDAVA